MRNRSLGVTSLAFGSVMVALYAQYAAIVLLLTGSVFAAAGSMHGALTLFVGAIFLGLTVAGYVVGYGYWTRAHWSWAGGIVVFAVLIGANVSLSILSTDFRSSLLPTIGAIIAIAALQLPALKRDLLGDALEREATIGVSEGLGAAKGAH